MKLDSKKIKEIYNEKVYKHYDLPISHMFKKYKEKTYHESSLKLGDRVVVFCCGTGLDFFHIINRIGSEGRITGVDFSTKMLEKAKKRCKQYGWKNIELIEADVTDPGILNNRTFDAGICTLGISIIPDYKKAYNNLVSLVKEGGEIIIGDMQLAKDWYSRFNPFTILLAKRFGGTYEGHNNSTEILLKMKETLKNIKTKELFLKSYYYCIGTKFTVC